MFKSFLSFLKNKKYLSDTNGFDRTNIFNKTFIKFIDLVVHSN